MGVPRRWKRMGPGGGAPPAPPPVTRDRLVHAALAPEQRAEIAVSIGIAGIDPQRPREEGLRVLEAMLLGAHVSEIDERVHEIRARRERPLATRCRLIAAA